MLHSKVLRAVDKLGGRVTLGDVLLAVPDFEGGAPDLRRELVEAATATGAHLESAPNGEVVYVFPARARAVALTRATASTFAAASRRAVTLLWRAFRVAFGLFLVASICIVVAAIFAMMIIVMSQGGERRGGGGPLLPTFHGGGGGGGPGGGFHHHHHHHGSMDGYFLGLTIRDMLWMMYLTEPERNAMRRARRHGYGGLPDPAMKAGRGPGGGGRGGGGGGGGGGDGGGPGPWAFPGGESSDDEDEQPGGDDGWDAEAREAERLGLREDGTEESFLEAIFAFVFGRGDPNHGLAGRRWRAISMLVRANKGAVFAEQVAPFLDACLLGGPAGEAAPGRARALLQRLAPRWARRAAGKDEDRRDASSMHEGYMLEVLARLGGHAESSDDGRLVYVFPHLQVTALPSAAAAAAAAGPSSSSAAPAPARPCPTWMPAPVAPPIYERKWRVLPGGQHQGPVVALGACNLLLLLFFRSIGGMDFALPPPAPPDARAHYGGRKGRVGNRRYSGPSQGERPPPLAIILLSWLPAAVSFCFPVLITYAGIFFLVPLTRALWVVWWANPRIQRRNLMRRTKAGQLIKHALREAAQEKARLARPHQELVVVPDPSESGP